MLHISIGADAIQLRKGKILEAFRINYVLITDIRHVTFRSFSFCLISTVPAVSWGAQLLQMLSFNSQIPVCVLQAAETVLAAPTDASCTTCAV